MRLQHNKTDANDAELLAELATMKQDIARLTLEIERFSKRTPLCRRLMTAPGVSPITALAFAATIDEPGRFAKSRAHLVGQWRLSGPDRAALPIRRDGL